MGNKTSKLENKPVTAAASEPAIASQSNVSDDTIADWLVVGGDFEVKLLEQLQKNQLEAEYQAHRKGSKYLLFVPEYKNMNSFIGIAVDPYQTLLPSISDSPKDSWAYYRDIAANLTQNPEISRIPKMSYFVFAQYFKDTKTTQLVPESLRLSLLSNLRKLSHDDAIKYDLRDATTGQYLYSKTKQFGVPITDMLHIVTSNMQKGWSLPNEDQEELTKEVALTLSTATKTNDEYQIEPGFDNNDCIVYTINNGGDKVRNTAFIHDLIDPNKSILTDHKLWIPAIFDCATNDISRVIRSSILGLDYVKYRTLYLDIANVFKSMIQPMFENVLNYKLSSREKVIVKSMKYVLQKKGDFYEGNVHREGMGENIVGIAIYYPQVTAKQEGMKDGKLKLSIPDVCNSFLKCGGYEFEIAEGSCVCFSNQGFHQLPVMQYERSGSGGDAISRTILTFFLVNRCNTEYVKASDDVGLAVNLEQYWRYFVVCWLRESGVGDGDYGWMYGVIERYVLEAEMEDFVYYKRFKMRHEKNKPLIKEVLPNNIVNYSSEETSYTFGYDQSF